MHVAIRYLAIDNLLSYSLSIGFKLNITIFIKQVTNLKGNITKVVHLIKYLSKL